MMGINSSDIRVITPATGGGFGARTSVYPEYAPLLLAARQLGKPVKWASTRAEGFLTDLQSRDHRLRGELALDAEGRFTAMRVKVDWRHGAYVVPRNLLVMIGFLPPTLGGVYAVPEVDVEMTGYVTNTTPQGAYRGIGRVEATYIMESLVHAAAAATGIDEAALQSRNTSLLWMLAAS